MKPSKTGFWRTKEGTLLRITEMTDQHLINSMKMLERSKADLVESALDFAADCRGEMASYYAEQDAASYLDGDVGDVFPKFDELEEEAEKRGLIQRKNGRRVYKELAR